MRDLLFEPASLDEWLAPGRRWEDPPPEVEHASEGASKAPGSRPEPCLACRFRWMSRECCVPLRSCIECGHQS